VCKQLAASSQSPKKLNLKPDKAYRELAVEHSPPVGTWGEHSKTQPPCGRAWWTLLEHSSLVGTRWTTHFSTHTPCGRAWWTLQNTAPLCGRMVKPHWRTSGSILGSQKLDSAGPVSEYLPHPRRSVLFPRKTEEGRFC